MIILLEDKLQEKQNIDELRICLEYFKKFKSLLSEMNELNDMMIEDILSVTANKGDINIFQLACICKTQEEFTETAKGMLEVFDGVGIIKYDK